MNKFIPFLLMLFFICPRGISQSSISGKVYNDLNNNLVYDSGEELANIKVWLFNYSAVSPYYMVQPITEVFTDGAGNYNFSGLAAGDYQVRVGVSTLPPTLNRAVADNDSYPNGLTDILGVNGSSSYTQINFGFAANSETPSFSSNRSFKWNTTNTFTGGQLSNTYNLSPEICNGDGFNPTITWTTNRTCAPGMSNGFGTEQFPSATTGAVVPYNWPGINKGGINAADSTFQINMGGTNCYDPVNNDRQTTTILFNCGVKNVKFSIYDIDHADPQANTGRIDHVKITGYLGSIPVIPVIINPSSTPWNTISGNSVCGFADYPLNTYTLAFNSQNEDHGTVNVYFQNTISSIVIEYEEYCPVMLQGKGINDATPAVLATNEASWSNRLPTVRGISIGGIDYTFDCAYFLPITISSFSVTEKDCAPVLKWSVSNSVNFKQFEIERSSDGYNFTSIGILFEQPNNPEYTFTDNFPDNGNNFYRLRFRDRDGHNSTGQVVHISMTCSRQKKIRIIPNPVAENQMEVILEGYGKGNYSVQVFNEPMQQVYHSILSINESGEGHLIIPVSWVKGIYFLLVKNYNGTLEKMEKIIIR